MKFIKFLFSKVFFINLIIACILLIASLFILNRYLNKITKHGEKVVVPNVINKKISDLDDNLLNKGFRYQIMDSVWERKLPKGIIRDQKPAPGDSVKEGRKIYLTINARSDEMIPLSIGRFVNGTSTAREALVYISSIDIEHDNADKGKKLLMPILALWAKRGVIETCFDALKLWRLRADKVEGEALPAGHYLAEEIPEEVAKRMSDFFSRNIKK